MICQRLLQSRYNVVYSKQYSEWPDRFNEHRRSVDKTNFTSKSKHTTVAERLLSHPNHYYTDIELIELIPLEPIHSSRDSIRKARESFLTDLPGTLEPYDMKRNDES